MNNDKFITDIIIIGSGIGGLIAGIECVRMGLNTTIIEQHYQPGGCCSSFIRKDFTFDVGAHFFGGLGNNHSFFGNYLKKLNLGIEFIQFDPLDRYHFSNETIEFPSNPNAFIKFLTKNFPKEKKIDAFINEMRKIFLYSMFGRTDSPVLEKYRSLNYKKMLDLFLKDEKLKYILSLPSEYQVDDVKNISAIAMSSTLSSFLYHGAYYPKGGTGKFTHSLAEKFEQLGGKLLLSHKVDKIIIKNNHIKGVICSDKNTSFRINSKIVISNADAKQTISKLIGKKYFDDKYYSNLINMQESSSCFMLFLGVDIPSSELKSKDGWHFNSSSNDEIPLLISIPSALDETLAPLNKSVIRLYIRVPQNEVNKFSENRKVIQNLLLRRVETIIPGINDKILIIESATPATLEKYTLNSKGAIMGWASTPAQSWINRLSNETPIQGLYLCSHWTYPGGGILTVFGAVMYTMKLIKNKYLNS